MDQICLVVPITAGKTDDARDFMRELEDQNKPDYDRSERRIGVTKEVWYLAHPPAGDQFVTKGPARSLLMGPVPRRPMADPPGCRPGTTRHT